MQKALALLALIVSPSIICAQGWVVLDNRTGLVQQWTSSSDPTLAPVPVGGGYVQLIAAPKGNALLRPLGVYAGSSGFLPGYSSLVGFLAANPGWAVPYAGEFGATPLAPVPISLAPGVFNGGAATIINIRNGADADYLVIGWTGPYATYDAAYAADLANPGSSFLGISAVATTRTADPFLVNPEAPIPLNGTFQGMTLAPAVIPEPTSVLLAGLSAVLLLLFGGKPWIGPKRYVGVRHGGMLAAGPKSDL